MITVLSMTPLEVFWSWAQGCSSCYQYKRPEPANISGFSEKSLAPRCTGVPLEQAEWGSRQEGSGAKGDLPSEEDRRRRRHGRNQQGNENDAQQGHREHDAAGDEEGVIGRRDDVLARGR
jgi:hypothetical protein